MPQQYHAADTDTGLEVQVTGEFPEDPDDRVRIARTTNLFTRLMATILSTENDYERRERFKAIETQLELADALIRGDTAEVQQLMRSTLTSMGVTEEQLREAQDQIRKQLESMGGDASALESLFGTESEPAAPADDLPSLEDLGPLEGLFEGAGDQPTEPDGPADASDDTPPEEAPPADPAPDDRS